MKEFVSQTILPLIGFVLVVFITEYFSKAKYYQKKIRQQAINNNDMLISVLRHSPDWSFELSNIDNGGDMRIDLGLNLETRKRQFLLLTFLNRGPNGGGFRKGVIKLYRELEGRPS